MEPLAEIQLRSDLLPVGVKVDVAQSIVVDLLVVRAVQILWQLMFSLSQTQRETLARQVAGLITLAVEHLFMVVMVVVKTPMAMLALLDTSKLLRHKVREI